MVTETSLRGIVLHKALTLYLIEIYHNPPSVEVSTAFRLLVISQCHFSRKFAANEVGSPSVAACRFLLLPATILHHISWACENCKQDLPHLWPTEGLLEANHLNLLLDCVALAPFNWLNYCPTPYNCERITEEQHNS